MKTTRYYALTRLLLSCLLLLLLTVTVSAADIVASGNCGAEGDGSNLTWVLDSDGVLTISGQGKMADYTTAYSDEDGKPAWYSYRSVLKALVIRSGVTSIGSYAFQTCNGFTGNLTIPNSVTSIGEGAFGECYGFTGNLTIPDSVTGIGDFAFEHCEGFTGNLIIPNSVISIGSGAFSKCSGFTGCLNIPNRLTSIESAVFAWCSGFTGNLTIPNSVTSIGDVAFEGCSGFTGNLTISDSVTSIGYYAFDGISGDVYFRGNAPSASGSSFDWKSTLYYIPDTIGWTDTDAYDASTGTWNGLTLKTWDGYLQITTNIAEKISANQYGILVINNAGIPIEGALVTYGSQKKETDKNGLALFEKFTIGQPLITVEKEDYITWSNADSNWEKSPSHYETVILYDKSYGVYKLHEARYANNNLMTGSLDILTNTKKLSLKNTGDMIGDLDRGDFYIGCSASASDGIVRYELWQRDRKIAEDENGWFGQLSVTSFSKGGGCFVRVVTSDGEQVDTHINLEFAESSINKDMELSLSSNEISFKVSDDTPFLGGSTYKFKLPIRSKITVTSTDDKFQFGFNLNVAGGKTEKEQIRAAKDLFRKARRAGDLNLGKLSGQDEKIFKSLIADKNKVSFFKNGEVNFLGYAEADLGSSTAKGEVMLQFKLDVADFEYNTWVVVPVTVQVKLGVEGGFVGEISYDWANATLLGSLDFDFSMKLTAFGGVGVSRFVGVGAYGEAELKTSTHLIKAPIYLKSVDLTGELGLKVYLGMMTRERPFAHNTWHLYSANNVQAHTAMRTTEVPWDKGLNDASQYRVDDLSYLAEESDWLGGITNHRPLLMASSTVAKTEFKNLLTDTYRNAQPVMVSGGDALYAAFIRADAETGARYVVVTKSTNGVSWISPVRVDADAIIDDAPTLCVDDDGTIWLAYAKTTSDPGNSILAYAQNQTIVVGSIDPETLVFTESKAFTGNGFAHMQRLTVLNDQPVLMWADTALTDEDSVLLPTSGAVCCATYSDDTWSEVSVLADVSGAIQSVTPGLLDGKLVAAYLLNGALYTTADPSTALAEGVFGRVTYGVLPGTSEAVFLWNGNDVLKSANGNEISAEGISHEYVIVGDKVYFSMATENSANLAVLQYTDEEWNLPIQLTGDSRYLENLSVAHLGENDFVLGMHTAVSITENGVEDAKNLVYSRVLPVSDLRIDDVDYDDSVLVAGESIPVTLMVTNAGDHTVNSIELHLNDSLVKTESVVLLPGQSVEITTAVVCPSVLTSYKFEVREPDEDDYMPFDNSCEISIGYADATVELAYQQIGTSKMLIATVTNQGIETASGSVVFYDADGDLVAKRTFEDLASGDVAIASYDVADSSVGGDVSAKVMLDQTERYTYNNEATMHILAPYFPTAIRSVKSTAKGVAATIYCEVGVEATVYCAAYNADGKMLKVESQKLSAGEETSVEFAVGMAAVTKVFVLSDTQVPLCNAETNEGLQ